MHKDYKRLPLDGMRNARDLGGYPTADGKMTSYHKMIRADAPAELSERDAAYLKELGLKLCIDLRSPEETEAKPHYFQGDADVQTVNIRLMESLREKGSALKKVDNLGDLYVYMADYAKAEIAEVFKLIANVPEDGLVMFNCTAGKDRTGITAALLLAICGVDYHDIVSDYMVSEIYNRMNISKIRTVSPEVSLAFFKSDPRNIERFFEHIGGPESALDFLIGCGVGRNDLEKIVDRMTE